MCKWKGNVCCFLLTSFVTNLQKYLPQHYWSQLGPLSWYRYAAFQLSLELLESLLVFACMLPETGTNGSGWLHPTRNHYRKLTYQAPGGNCQHFEWQKAGTITTYFENVLTTRTCYSTWPLVMLPAMRRCWMNVATWMYAPPIRGPDNSNTAGRND